MNKPKFFMMVGLPGSGKSHLARKLAAEYNAAIHSSDSVRFEISGDENDQSNNDLVFTTLHNRIKNDLSANKNCIYDACNISKKTRMAFLREISNIDCEKHCIIAMTPYEQCLKNNLNRDRVVPESAIKKMYLSFFPPYFYEGWDNITIEYWKDSQNSLSFKDFIDRSSLISQDNHNHALTIGHHCLAAGNEVIKYYEENGKKPDTLVCAAAALHDEGKIFTKRFYDCHGNPTEEAHYFSHDSVGAYNSFFYNFACEYGGPGIGEHLYVALLIAWHMRPFLAWDKSEKCKEKDKKMIGEKIFNDILIIHAADLAAH